jgi:hypothetical protein
MMSGGPSFLNSRVVRGPSYLYARAASFPLTIFSPTATTLPSFIFTHKVYITPKPTRYEVPPCRRTLFPFHLLPSPNRARLRYLVLNNNDVELSTGPEKMRVLIERSKRGGTHPYTGLATLACLSLRVSTRTSPESGAFGCRPSLHNTPPKSRQCACL